MTSVIQAGDVLQVAWTDGNWLFLDAGFSNKSRSCGLLVRDEAPRRVRFGEAVKEITEQISKSRSPLNLVIEAPLSVCFDQDGNPKRRRIEQEKGKSRYWYCGAGCSVMVAAMYLIRAIHQSKPPVAVRLFEGFISFKKLGEVSSHESDVLSLRDVVQNTNRSPGLIYSPDELKEVASDKIISAFAVAGLDCGIPPVIKPAPVSAA
jgi:hypothetical protein